VLHSHTPLTTTVMSLDISATDTIISATGDLGGLHGVLSEVATLGANGPVGTYSGQIHFGKP